MYDKVWSYSTLEFHIIDKVGPHHHLRENQPPILYEDQRRKLFSHSTLMRHHSTRKVHSSPQKIKFLPLEYHTFSLTVFLSSLLYFWKGRKIIHCKGFLHQFIGTTHHQQLSELHSLLLHPSFHQFAQQELVNHPLLWFCCAFGLLVILLHFCGKTLLCMLQNHQIYSI